MLLKILLTVLVILGAVLVLRRRVLRVQQTAPAARPAAEKNRLAYAAAYGLVLVMLAGAAFFVYLEWADSYRVVNVQVIDARTGKSVNYRAHRGEVEGRTFRTLDGVTITLADVERMELGAE